MGSCSCMTVLTFILQTIDNVLRTGNLNCWPFYLPLKGADFQSCFQMSLSAEFRSPPPSQMK